jgi:hypothetical protein
MCHSISQVTKGWLVRLSTTQTGNDSAAVASVPGTAAVPKPPDVLIGAGGDPLALGLSVFLIGALVLGMTFVGVFPAAAT